MLSGYTTSMVVNGNPLFTLAWTPFLAWAAEGLATTTAAVRRRSGLQFAAFFGLAILSGNPSGIVIAWLLTLAWVVLRAPRGQRRGALLALALASAAALPLAALSELPAMYLLADSGRAHGIPLADATIWSLHPLRLVEWVWPFALGHGLRGGQGLASLFAATGGGHLEAGWSASLHVGLPGVILASLGWRRWRAALVIAAAFLILALGRFTPLYAAFRTIFPLEQFVRYPEKYVVIPVLVCAVLASFGATRVIGGEIPRRTLRILGAVTGIVLVLVTVLGFTEPAVVAWLAAVARQRGLALDAGATTELVFGGGVSTLAAALLVTATIWAAPRARSSPSLQRLVKIVLATTLGGTLVLHTWALLPLVSRAAVAKVPELLSAIADQPRPGQPPIRILRRAKDSVPLSVSEESYALFQHHSASASIPGRFGFAAVSGLNPAETRRYASFVRAAGATNLERVLDLLDVRYAILPVEEAATLGLPFRAGPIGSNVLVENTQRRPRALVASRWTWVATEAEVYADLFAPATDKAALRLIGSGEAPSAAESLVYPCRVDEPRPEDVTLSCDSPHGGRLVYLIESAPGWSATVDGNPAALAPADALFPSLPIAPGAHQIALRYRTPGLRVGGLISALAWLLWGLALWRLRAPGRLPA
jgi:hypothetical protein